MKKLAVRRKTIPVWYMGRRTPVMLASFAVTESDDTTAIAEFPSREAAEAYIQGWVAGWKEGVVEEYLAGEAGKQRAEEAAREGTTG